MTRSTLVLCGLAAILMVAGPACAIDHSNLDVNRPLDIEDAYAISYKEWAVEGGLGYDGRRKANDHGLLDLQVLYGAWLNTHVSLGTTLQTDPRTVLESQRSGDLELAVLHNFNQETLWCPAFAGELTVNLPTGVGSQGVDTTLKGIVTRTVGNVRLHLNGLFTFAGDTIGAERDHTYKAILGASWGPGLPKRSRLVLVGELFTEESRFEGESNTFGAGFGARYQQSQRVVLDAGITSELSGPSDRSQALARVGASIAF